MALQDIDSINIAALPTDQVKGYGLLYNPLAYVNGNFPPSNWKVPGYTEFNALVKTVQTSSNIKSNRNISTNITGWYLPGIDAYKFSWLPAGYRPSIFFYAGYKGYLASTTPNGNQYYTWLCEDAGIAMTNSGNFGVSVRLVMINTSGWTVGDTFTDLDGNVYDTVEIGGQVWMSSNWKCTKLSATGTAISNITDNAAWTSAVVPAYCSYNNLPLVEE